ncbi:hypothetical protein [Paraburkholderia sp.]|uniref:hypothetical protein n=1 Tax=Paraburkholderia sp. TaxID=1926495 RepID=UPI003D6DDA0E
MQAFRRAAQWMLPVAIGWTAVAVDVCAAEVAAPVPALGSVIEEAVPAIGNVSATTSDARSPAAPVAEQRAAPTQPDSDSSFGVAMTPEQLDTHRGGDQTISNMTLTGAVSDNSAKNVTTGSNAITQGSFANSSGLPTVIQNSGANVLIQNATILNVRFGN